MESLGSSKSWGHTNHGVRSFVITSKEGSGAGFPPLLLSRWRKAGNQNFQALPRLATHTQSTAFMRVCQPAPVPCVAGYVLAVLKRADPSFLRKSEEGQNESAVNDKGFEVDFIRREAGTSEPLWRSNAGWQSTHRIASRSNAVVICAKRRLSRSCWTKGW